ncbi:MAG TPA: branched-chain amino acid ABC transporter permease [Thermodesulfobacteriota bacterium]
MAFFLNLVVTGVVVGSVYALVAMGFVLIFKASRVVNFAQGEFLMVGAYVCLSFLVWLAFPYPAAVLGTLVFAVLLALLVERVILRPMIGEPILSVVMVTLGLASVLRAAVQSVYGTDIRAFPEFFTGEPFRLGGVAVTPAYAGSFVAVLVLMGLLSLFFKYSKAGVAMRATAFDQQVALSMGISVKRMFALAWAIAAMVSVVGGIFLGNMRGGVDGSLAFIGLKVIPVVILGGLDSLAGAFVGGLLVGVLENLAGGYLDPYVGGGAKEVAPFVLLILILMVRPYGLFGTEEIERV